MLHKKYFFLFLIFILNFNLIKSTDIHLVVDEMPDCRMVCCMNFFLGDGQISLTAEDIQSCTRNFFYLTPSFEGKNVKREDIKYNHHMQLWKKCFYTTICFTSFGELKNCIILWKTDWYQISQKEFIGESVIVTQNEDDYLALYKIKFTSDYIYICCLTYSGKKIVYRLLINPLKLDLEYGINGRKMIEYT